MNNPGLPPADARRSDLLRAWPQCLKFHLFTNTPQDTGPRHYSDYIEPNFLGYETQFVPTVTVTGDDPELRLLQVELTQRWTLREPLPPTIIRGWFLTATYSDQFVELICEHIDPHGAIMRYPGEQLRTTARLTALQWGDPPEELLQVETHLVVLAGEPIVGLMRGNDLKVLKNLQKAMQAVRVRDAKMLAAGSGSRMARIEFFPATAEALLEARELIEDRLQVLRNL